jgi:hypothetical protein
VDRVARSSSGFSVEIVALHEDRVIGQTTNPDVALANLNKLNMIGNNFLLEIFLFPRNISRLPAVFYDTQIK